ncbi:MAG: metal-dependent hydrolase [Candidatus Electryoneaceae bacterium]|nr:metal-dependent hydrolase [Candidatus Electryoneaceae bacterium]
MANGREHLTVGTMVTVIYIVVSSLFWVIGWLDLAIYLIIGMMASVWPDIDTKSMGQKAFYRLFFIFNGYLIVTEQYQISAYLASFVILPLLTKHRGWTHTSLSMILIPSPLLLYPMYQQSFERWDGAGLPYYLAAVIGYMSHLILDTRLFRRLVLNNILYQRFKKILMKI